ncbi:hypothetical protein GN956_G9582 [Arapaima gigas]
MTSLAAAARNRERERPPARGAVDLRQTREKSGGGRTVTTWVLASAAATAQSVGQPRDHRPRGSRAAVVYESQTEEEHRCKVGPGGLCAVERAAGNPLHKQ